MYFILLQIITGAIGIATSIIMVFIVRRTGKRKLYLWSMFSVVFCLFFLGLYAYINLPSDASSYKPDQISGKDNSWVPTFLFIALNVCAGIGSNLIPWVMISEIFPLKLVLTYFINNINRYASHERQ